MDVLLQYFDGCPNWRIAEARLRSAMQEVGRGEEIRLEEVTSEEEARQRHFTGSPTIRLNGVDPFSDVSAQPGLACRVYRSPSGFDGSPSVEELVAALRRASANEAKAPRTR